jgi:hypothetical protein
MSQFGGPGDVRLGGGYIDLTARGTEQVKAAVTSTAATVQTQTAAMASATEQSAARQNTANVSAAKGWKQFSASITSTIGGFTALAAIIGTVVRAVTSLFTMLQKSNQELANFLKNVNTTTPDRGLGQILDQIGKLNERDGPGSLRRLLDQTGLTTAAGFETAQEELERLRTAARGVGNVLAQYGEYRRQEIEDIKTIADLTTTSWKVKQKQLEEELRLEKGIAAARIEGIKEATTAKEKFLKDFEATSKGFERAMQATAEAMVKAIEAAQRRQDEFNQRQAVSLENVLSSLAIQERRLLNLRNAQWPGGGKP